MLLLSGNAMTRKRTSRTCQGLVLALLVPCASCAPDPSPPPPLYYAGVPVRGSLNEARRERFNFCFNDTAVSLSCRRHDVMVFGLGPFEATLDLRGRWGQSGFHQITIWHKDDQRAVFQMLPELARRGWRYCYAGTESFGDQAIFSRAGATVKVYVDISYYGARRIRIMPLQLAPPPRGRCIPDEGLGRFGINAL